MRVDFLRDDAPECPLVRFYSPNPGDFYSLRRVADLLRETRTRSIELAAKGGFELVGIREVRLTNAAACGMIEERPGRLVWGLQTAAWEAVAELIAPLCEPSSHDCFQWLDEAGGLNSKGLSVLASVSAAGEW